MNVIAIILIIVIILLIHNPLENYTNFIEYKTPSYKNINKLENFNFIYCKLDGIYNIFSDNVFYRNKTKNSIKNVFNLDTIKSGFYNYTYQCIISSVFLTYYIIFVFNFTSNIRIICSIFYMFS